MKTWSKIKRAARWQPIGLTLVAAAVWFALWDGGAHPGQQIGGGNSGDSSSNESAAAEQPVVRLGEAVATFDQWGAPADAKSAPRNGAGPLQPRAESMPEPLAPPAHVEPEASPPTPNRPTGPAEPMSDRTVEYHIAVSLDAGERALRGTQTVTWRNPGKRPVQNVYFHLYPNAFESGKTTFMRESGGRLREDRRTSDSVGSMRIVSLKTSEGLDLTPRMTFEQPDDGNKADRTLMNVRLAKPVAPNETVTLHMTFEVKLPEVFARMGYKGNFVMAGQWYPKIAAYEPAGVRGRTDEGWNAHQYHGNSEFYADFGIYSVKIQVPSRYTVAATGFPTAPAVEDKAKGTKLYHFYADDVHDFAWAASPDFIYAEEPFSAPGVPGVKIKLYLDPAHLELKDRYVYAAKKSLENYSVWYGPYPYSTLSIVVPPAGAGGAGGMEYPTLVTAWAADTAQMGFELERVVVHEIGHQFWYGMVANNEFEEAWLDEGFTSYAEDRVMEAEFGVSPNPVVEAVYMTSPAALTRFSWQFDSHDHYADNVYVRGKLILLAIERDIGRDAMNRVLRTYFDRWRFRHPSTRDFQAVLENVTKRSWTTFFDQFVYGDRMVDYAIERIVEKKVRGDRGGYAYTVTVAGRSGKSGPVFVRFVYEDGQSVKQLWQGESDTAVFTLPARPVRLSYAVIDPDFDIVLEHKRINNFMRTDIDDKREMRWTAGVSRFVEALIGTFVW